MEEARIYYLRGQLSEALQILKNVIPKAKSIDKEFWKSIEELAEILNDLPLYVLSLSQIK